MTPRNAERITGLDVTAGFVIGSRTIHYATASESGVEIARAEGCNQAAALGRLVEVIYKRRSEQTMQEQGWRCADCNGIKPLTIHHKVFRSHGRDDRRENLIAICVSCHDSRHNQKRGVKALADEVET